MRVTTTPSRSTVAALRPTFWSVPARGALLPASDPTRCSKSLDFPAPLGPTSTTLRIDSTPEGTGTLGVVTVVMTDTLLPYRRLHNRLRAARHVPKATSRASPE